MNYVPIMLTKELLQNTLWFGDNSLTQKLKKKKNFMTGNFQTYIKTKIIV